MDFRMTVKKERGRGNMCKIGANHGPGTAPGAGVKEMDQTESPSPGGPVEHVQRKKKSAFDQLACAIHIPSYFKNICIGTIEKKTLKLS